MTVCGLKKDVSTRCNFEVRPTKSKVRTRLKFTIRKLKNKLTAGTRERRRLKAIIRRRDHRISSLEAENRVLRKRLAPIKVANHHYPAQMIAMAVFIVVHANGSLRCAAKTVAYYAKLMGWDFGQPSHAMVSNWSKRLGLYALDHLGTKTGKFIGIIDESIQIGREKCLLFLGVRIPEDRSFFAPFTIADVEVLGVEVQNSWKADEVGKFLKYRLDHHDKVELEYMISDQGGNLLGAMENLNIDAVSDCSHVLMNALKKLLSDHAILKAITSFMGTFRRQNILSERTHLCPPTLRDKDRFLRIFVILDWVGRINSYWPKLPRAHRSALAYLQRKKVKAFLNVLGQLRQIICIATEVLKTSGISYRSRQAWSVKLAKYRTETTLCVMAEELVSVVENYFDSHEWLLARHGRLLCCSDIIESIFGRYKNKGGMKVISADVLMIPLYAHAIDVDFVQQGLTTVSQKMLDRWHQDHTCDNRYSVLRRLKPQLNSVTPAA